MHSAIPVRWKAEIPLKEQWHGTNAVHFPPFSRVENGDLESAESTERKSSTGGKPAHV